MREYGFDEREIAQYLRAITVLEYSAQARRAEGMRRLMEGRPSPHNGHKKKDKERKFAGQGHRLDASDTAPPVSPPPEPDGSIEVSMYRCEGILRGNAGW